MFFTLFFPKNKFKQDKRRQVCEPFKKFNKNFYWKY